MLCGTSSSSRGVVLVRLMQIITLSWFTQHRCVTKFLVCKDCRSSQVEALLTYASHTRLGLRCCCLRRVATDGFGRSICLLSTLVDSYCEQFAAACYKDLPKSRLNHPPSWDVVFLLLKGIQYKLYIAKHRAIELAVMWEARGISEQITFMVSLSVD